MYEYCSERMDSDAILYWVIMKTCQPDTNFVSIRPLQICVHACVYMLELFEIKILLEIIKSMRHETNSNLQDMKFAQQWR
jgi:hypothetical protein